MTTHLNVNGTWKEIGADGVWVNVSGTWKTVASMHSNVGGTWKDVYIRDNVGPAAPTNVTVTWTTSGLRCDWIDPVDADYSHMEVLVLPDGEPFLIFPNVAAGVQTHLCTYAPYYKVMTYYLTPYDTNGNAGPTVAAGSMAWTGTARGRYPSPREFLPIDSGTYRNSGWRTDPTPTTRVYQGSTTNGHNYGTYFYGDTIYNELRGTTVSEMSFEYVRVNSSGQGFAVVPEIHWSTIASKASSPVGTINEEFAGPGVCINGSCWSFAMANPPSSWYGNFVTPGQTRAKSIVLYSDDQTLQDYIGNVSLSYMQLFGYNERPMGTTIIPGRVKFTHSG